MTRPANMPRWAAWALVALASLALEVPASAQQPPVTHKFDEVVRETVAEGRSVRAIVRFTNDAARLRGAEIVASRGGRVRRALNDVTALTVDMDASTASELSAELGTLTISVDATVRSAGFGDGRRAARANDARRARAQFNRAGRGVSVAVIDSGVQPHADLPLSRIRRFVDFVNGRSMPYDDFGHGTHVAGIVAGSGAASAFLEEPYVGAAPEVDIVALKVLDSQGAGKTSDVIAALEWVARYHAAYNIRIVNLSLGHPVYEPAATDPLVQAAEALVERGIVVVASAGNLGIDPTDNVPGHGGITSPANGPRIIAVGAVDNQGTNVRGDDVVADYSSRGPTRFDLIVKPDLVASGHRVASLSAPGSSLFDNYPALHVAPGRRRSASYMVLSGTSMAAPQVSGTAALVLETNPRLSVGAVRAVLEFTAQQLPATSPLAQGAGQVNATGAVRLARLIKPRVERGQIWLKSQGGVPQPYDILEGEPIAWSKNIVWGNRILGGDSAYVHLALWDDNIVWGQDLDNIVWGECSDAGCDNIVWGQCNGAGCDNIVWGETVENIVWGQDLDNIVWGECASVSCDNIVWGEGGDNIVWGESGGALGYWAGNTVWGFWDNSVDWPTVTRNHDNIVWGEDYLENIVWGECAKAACDNIVWGENLGVLTIGGRQ